MFESSLHRTCHHNVFQMISYQSAYQMKNAMSTVSATDLGLDLTEMNKPQRFSGHVIYSSNFE